jgi:hypothetical protein
MNINISLIAQNETQSQEFSLYNLIIYYLLIETIYGEYDYGYEFYSILNPEDTEYHTFTKLETFKCYLRKLKNEPCPRLAEPIPLHHNYMVWKGMRKVAAAIYLGIREIQIMLTRKDPRLVYNLEWLKKTYSPEAAAEIHSHKTRILKVIRALA